MSTERRIHTRKLVNAKVLLIHPAIGQLQTYTHDISNGGVFVLLQKQPDLPLGTELDMCLLDSEQDDIVFKMKIARTDKLGFGLEFQGYVENGVFNAMESLFKKR